MDVLEGATRVKCPLVAEVKGEGDLFLVSKDVTDQDMLDAFIYRIGTGEWLTCMPRAPLLQEEGH